MSSLTETAQAFFAACETGQGWETCHAWCTPDAGFSAQSEPIMELRTLQQDTDWMRQLRPVLPDARYVLQSFADNPDRQKVCACGVFSGTQRGNGSRCPPTGWSNATDYVYVREFAGDKISRMTEIWSAGWTANEYAHCSAGG
jgi:predicted ester cyclase